MQLVLNVDSIAKPQVANRPPFLSISSHRDNNSWVIAMDKDQDSIEALSDKELLEFIDSLSGELIVMAKGRGLYTLLPALRGSVTASRNILGKMAK